MSHTSYILYMALENEYFAILGKLFTAKQRRNILMRMVRGLYKEVLEFFESYEGPLE